MYLFIILYCGRVDFSRAATVVWHLMIRDHRRSWLRSSAELGEWRRSPEFVVIIRIAAVFFILVGFLSAWSLSTH